jgi:small subunit ribosomal protein S14
MSKYIIKDRQKRIKYLNNELYFRSLKILLSNQKLSKKIRTQLFYWVQTLSTQVYQTQIKNRCILTGYSRSVSRRFRISRMQFKKYAVTGLLPGIKKASW